MRSIDHEFQCPSCHELTCVPVAEHGFSDGKDKCLYCGVWLEYTCRIEADFEVDVADDEEDE